MAPATVLVVENDPTTRGLLHAFLEHRGHRVLSESEGEWALGVAEAEAVDLVVLDQRLSDLAGLDVLRRLRRGATTRELPVILLGGAYADPPPDLEALGPVAFLDKPLDLERFEAEVDEALVSRPARPTEARPAARGPIPRRGDLALVPFARLLGRFSALQAPGALLLQRSATKKVVFFEGGRPVFVQSNLLAESLGQVMLQERLLTEVELENALSHKRRTGQPLGDVLVERGVISEHHLAYALERQMARKLFDIFAWPDGAFRYRPEARHSGPRVSLPLGPVGLVFEGAARMPSERIELDLQPERHRMARAADVDRVRDAVLALEPAATGFVERLDGSRSVEALFRDPELGRGEALQLLYALVVTGHLALSEPPPPVLSDDLRDQVRARLDAEMRRIEQSRRRSPVPTPRPTRARALAADEAQAIEVALDATAAEQARSDYFDRLGVDAMVDDDALRAAYHRTSRALDPGRLLGGRDAPRLLQRAEANHLRVVRAFQVLSDAQSRGLYRGWQADPGQSLLPALMAADRAKAAEAALEQGRYDEAAAAYREAEALEPEVPAYGAAAAHATFAGGGAPEIALEAIRARRASAPDDPECMRYEARVLWAVDRKREALELYRSVLALDPDCIEASSALAQADLAEGGRGVMAKVAEGARAWLGRSET